MKDEVLRLLRCSSFYLTFVIRPS